MKSNLLKLNSSRLILPAIVFIIIASGLWFYFRKPASKLSPRLPNTAQALPFGPKTFHPDNKLVNAAPPTLPNFAQPPKQSQVRAQPISPPARPVNNINSNAIPPPAMPQAVDPIRTDPTKEPFPIIFARAQTPENREKLMPMVLANPTYAAVGMKEFGACAVLEPSLKPFADQVHCLTLAAQIVEMYPQFKDEFSMIEKRAAKNVSLAFELDRRKREKK